MESEYFSIDPNFVSDASQKRELAVELIDQILTLGYPRKLGTELVDYLGYRRKLTEETDQRKIHKVRFSKAKETLDRELGYFQIPVILAMREAQLAEQKRQFQASRNGRH